MIAVKMRLRKSDIMGKGFAARVKKMILNSEIVLEVLDSRFPEATRDSVLEQFTKEKKKILLFVLNKCDLVPEKFAKKKIASLKKQAPAVLFSAKKHIGSKALRSEIGKASKKLKLKKGSERARVCVIGYPNTGKS